MHSSAPVLGWRTQEETKELGKEAVELVGQGRMVFYR